MIDPNQLWHQGYIPTRHQLRAALRVSELLKGPGVKIADLRRAYPHTPSDGVFSEYDLMVGEEVLIAAGLARVEGECIELIEDLGEVGHETPEVCEILLSLYLVKLRPPWLAAATRSIEMTALMMPEGALWALGTTVQDAQRREDFLLAVEEKFEREGDRALGEEGEQFVLKACRNQLCLAGRPDLASKVRQVSRYSDLLGYDVVSHTITAGIVRIEVKASRAAPTAAVRFYLSRGEAAVGLRDGSWRLVLCYLPPKEDGVLLGWLAGEGLGEYLPTDSPRGGSWMRASVEVPLGTLRPGLPLGPGGTEIGYQGQRDVP